VDVSKLAASLPVAKAHRIAGSYQRKLTWNLALGEPLTLVICTWTRCPAVTATLAAVFEHVVFPAVMLQL
jgi:hypothetical protein